MSTTTRDGSLAELRALVSARLDESETQPILSQHASEGGADEEDARARLREMAKNSPVARRFLRGYGGDAAKASAALASTAAWRSRVKPELIDVGEDEAVRREIERGTVLVGGPDREGRTVLIVRAALHSAKQRDLAAMSRFIFALMEHSACGANPELMIVFDQVGMKIKNTDKELRAALLPDVQAHYPERLSRVFMCNSPLIFRAVWKVVRPMLDPATADKVSMLGGKYEAQLNEVVDPGVMPKTLGGELELEQCVENVFSLLENSCGITSGVPRTGGAAAVAAAHEHDGDSSSCRFCGASSSST
jgi:CRAL/TRIO domain